ncbi:UNVERIFIED_CONTAM: Ubiquitin carboxyl-terminal hydrolase 14, partial [Siphonaria sp. JEL0065]
MLRSLRGLAPEAGPKGIKGKQSLDEVVQNRVQRELELQQHRKLNYEKLNSDLLLREADALIRRQKIAPVAAVKEDIVAKEQSLIECYKNNAGRTLDCWKEVEELKKAVASAQRMVKSMFSQTKRTTQLTSFASVSVKWSGKKFDDVEVDLAQPGLVFKSQLFALTGVAPNRQKILVKGGTLKDDTDMSSLGLKEVGIMSIIDWLNSVCMVGSSSMLMGTVGELPKAPTAPVQFVEDLTDTQLAKALKVPAGLTNLGNTCYMNATLQCLRAVPELQDSLRGVPNAFSQEPRSNLVKSMSFLYTQLANSGDAVTPLVFLHVLRSNFQQFAEQNNHGFMQQDAEECWGEIVSALAEK